MTPQTPDPLNPGLRCGEGVGTRRLLSSSLTRENATQAKALKSRRQVSPARQAGRTAGRNPLAGRGECRVRSDGTRLRRAKDRDDRPESVNWLLRERGHGVCEHSYGGSGPYGGERHFSSGERLRCRSPPQLTSQPVGSEKDL